MSASVIVHKGRTNVLRVVLGFDVTGDTLSSEIRTAGGVLIATWTVTVVNAVEGELSLTLDNSITTAIAYPTGFMDIKRVSSGEPYAVFDHPLEVEFRATVTQ